jgi:hypothetical protein
MEKAQQLGTITSTTSDVQRNKRMYKNIDKYLLQRAGLPGISFFVVSEPLYLAVRRLSWAYRHHPQLSLSCQEIVTHSQTKLHFCEFPVGKKTKDDRSAQCSSQG